jgi:D-alanyl-D-alanine carboxypeptidase/D-alanyl-D-alanine-endopeptidase (penicillin-binding protein 4)
VKRHVDRERKGSMRRWRMWVALGCVTLFVFSLRAAPSAHAKSSKRSVPEELARWLERPEVKGLRVGLSFRRVSDGTLVASHQGSALLNPASGAKLLTTAVALMTYGPQAQVSTTVHGEIQEGGYVPLLVLRGEGDPKLLLPEIATLAQSVVARGVKKIGQIALDVSVFDGQTLPPAFEQKETDAGYRASIGAVASMFGAVEVTVHPGSRVGKRPRVVVSPNTSHVRVFNDAETTATKGPPLEVRGTDDGHGRLALRVRGTLRPDAEPWRGRRRVLHPDLLTVDLLREALEGLGVEVTSQKLPQVASDSLGPVLGVVKSAPLIESLRDVNRWSNNFMAEMVFKRLGSGVEAATFERAQLAVTQALVDLGIPSEACRVVNGSGLYRGTYVSADALTQLLVAMGGKSALGPDFRSTLPRPRGVGTLSDRLKSLPKRVWAKTGTLDEVVSLSGYLQTRTQGTWAFSVIINEATPARTGTLRLAVDRLIRQLARR